MVLEQRIGRVDRIGQDHTVIAVNIMQDNSVDERVYNVIENKLGQIMAELGIDKTSDVLDSTLERDSVNKLFLASLLDPARFEAQSNAWLNDIKKKLNDYRSTEGALPTITSDLIKTEKSQEYRHSPLPVWLEQAIVSWLDWKGFPWNKTDDGIVAPLDGIAEKVYTFDTRSSLENPVPEPLTLQHEIVQRIFKDAVPLTANSRIPTFIPDAKELPSGYWSLWALTAANHFASQEAIYPLFFSDDGDLFTALANDILVKLTQSAIKGRIIEGVEASVSVALLTTKAEEALMPRYYELEQKILTDTETIKINKHNAFDFQERQINRIGIESIKRYRIQKLQNEKQNWILSFDTAARIVPNLQCLLALRICHE